MCNTTGPKMFFQPSELGSQGNDMATVHASNPQATFDAGDPTNFPAPPQPPQPPAPAFPSARNGGGGTWGGRFPVAPWMNGGGMPSMGMSGGYTPFSRFGGQMPRMPGFGGMPMSGQFTGG